MIINQKHVKLFALDYCRRNRPKFTRISKEFIEQIDHACRSIIVRKISEHPSIGVTLK